MDHLLTGRALSKPSFWRVYRWQLGMIALIGIFYSLLLTRTLGPLNAFWSTDQGTKLLQVQSLLLNKFQSQALIYPGEYLDPEAQVSPLRGAYVHIDGYAYSQWPPLFAFLSCIPFFLFDYLGLYLIPISATLGSLVIVMLLSQRLLEAFWGYAALFVCALASPLLFYSMIFWEHTTAVFLVMLALWLLLHGYETNNFSFALLAGLVAGLTVWVRNEAILCAAGLMLGLLSVVGWRSLRSLIGFGIGLTIAVGGLLVFNYLSFGHILGAHVLVASQDIFQQVEGLKGALLGRILWFEVLLVPLQPGWFTALFALFAVSALGAHMLPNAELRRKAHSLGLLLVILISVGSLQILASNYLSNPYLNGGEQSALVLIVPLALFALLPLPKQESSGQEPHLSLDQLAKLLRNFALISILAMWMSHIPWGGSQWGPRMLLPLLPALVLWAFVLLSRWSQQAESLPAGRLHVTSVGRDGRAGASFWLEPLTSLALLAAIVGGLYAQIDGLIFLKATTTRNFTMLNAAAQSQQAVIICDTWYTPPLIAPLFYDQRLVFIVDDVEGFDGLLERMQANGIQGFYYLGTRYEQIYDESRYRDRLQAGDAQRFAHQLRGQIVQLR